MSAVTRVRIIVVVGVTLAVLAVVLATRAPRSVDEPAVRPTVMATATASLWPAAGRSLTFALDSRSAQEQQVAGARLGGAVMVRGALRLRGLEPDEQGRPRTGWSFPRVDEAVLDVLDLKLETAAVRQHLVGPELIVTRTDGALDVAARPGVDTLFVHVMRAIALDVSLETGLVDGGWTTEERTPRGVEVGRAERAGQVVTRTRDRLHGWDAARAAGIPDAAVLLDGGVHATFDDEGLLTFELDETMGVDTDVLAATPGPSAADAPSGYASMSLRRVDAGGASARIDGAVGAVTASSGDAAAAALRARAAGLEGAALVDTLRVFGAGGRVPSHNRFFWQATARLRLEPALCAQLVELFEQQPSPGRGLILDLLVGAGTPEAQAAAITALTSDAGRRDPRAPQLLSRLGFVEAPGPALLAALEDAARGTEGDAAWTQSARLTLGAAVGHAARDGGTSWSEAHALLVDQLVTARDARSRSQALRALGNAGLPRDDVRLASTAADDDAGVREATAMALRKLDTPVAHDALFDLVDDPAPAVQQRALASLDRRPLSPVDVRALEALIHEDTLAPEAATTLTDLLQHALEADAELVGTDSIDAARTALRALLQSEPEVPGLEARLFMLLEQG